MHAYAHVCVCACVEQAHKGEERGAKLESKMDVLLAAMEALGQPRPGGSRSARHSACAAVRRPGLATARASQSCMHSQAAAWAAETEEGLCT